MKDETLEEFTSRWKFKRVKSDDPSTIDDEISVEMPDGSVSSYVWIQITQDGRYGVWQELENGDLQYHPLVTKEIEAQKLVGKLLYGEKPTPWYLEEISDKFHSGGAE